MNLNNIQKLPAFQQIRIWYAENQFVRWCASRYLFIRSKPCV